jgi:hypothetical protein
MSEIGIKELRSVGILIDRYKHCVKRYGISSRSLRARTRGIFVHLLDALKKI